MFEKNLDVRFTDDPLVENQSTFIQIAGGKRTGLSKALAAMAEEILRNVAKQSVWFHSHWADGYAVFCFTLF